MPNVSDFRLGADVVASDADLDGWLERAIAFTRTLPPKTK